MKSLLKNCVEPFPITDSLEIRYKQFKSFETTNMTKSDLPTEKFTWQQSTSNEGLGLFKMIFAFTIISIIASLLSFDAASACDKSACGPIVSKCQLIGACRCTNINTTCYEECGQCLTDNFYKLCCSCVEICPQPPENDTDWGTSSVDVIDEAQPELFETLTSLPDGLRRWQEYHEPVPATTIDKETVSPPQQCTVAYFGKCPIEIFKCHDACKTMGASAYRWFYDGCCECVGQYCRNFGSNISRCGSCTVVDGHQQQEL